MVLNTVLIPLSKNVYLQLKIFSGALDLNIQLSTWIFKVIPSVWNWTPGLSHLTLKSGPHHLSRCNSIFLAFQVENHCSLIYRGIKRTVLLNESRIWPLISTFTAISLNQATIGSHTDYCNNPKTSLPALPLLPCNILSEEQSVRLLNMSRIMSLLCPNEAEMTPHFMQNNSPPQGLQGPTQSGLLVTCLVSSPTILSPPHWAAASWLPCPWSVFTVNETDANTSFNKGNFSATTP